LRTAIYGGSFDPPHIAHVLSASYVLSVGEVDRVIVVPVFHHAFEKRLSPFPHRLEMCRVAFEGIAHVFVSDLEGQLPSPNFTVNTVKALGERYPDDSFRLIVGADVLADTEHWHRFEELTKIAPLVVLGRQGFDAPGAPPAILPDVSSSEARTWFQEPAGEEQIRRQMAFIPAKVREVIEREGLYK
jgi:nicotinate-nucleotide adenylyltransferase